MIMCVLSDMTTPPWWKEKVVVYYNQFKSTILRLVQFYKSVYFYWLHSFKCEFVYERYSVNAMSDICL